MSLVASDDQYFWYKVLGNISVQDEKSEDIVIQVELPSIPISSL